MKVTLKSVAQALHETLHSVPQEQRDSVVAATLQYLLSTGRSRWIAQLPAAVERLEMQHTGTVAVTATTAREISSDDIAHAVERVLPGISVVIRQQVDPGIIGGISIETENNRWDYSMKRQLQNFAATIINE